MNPEIMRAAGFEKEVEMVKNYICPACHKPIDVSWTAFRDDLSRKEYKISGMCQKCQDEVFGKF